MAKKRVVKERTKNNAFKLLPDLAYKSYKTRLWGFWHLNNNKNNNKIRRKKSKKKIFGIVYFSQLYILRKI